jgi:hypothetical protein
MRLSIAKSNSCRDRSFMCLLILVAFGFPPHKRENEKVEPNKKIFFVFSILSVALLLSHASLSKIEVELLMTAATATTTKIEMERTAVERTATLLLRRLRYIFTVVEPTTFFII